MADSYIQLPADGTGKKTRTKTETVDGSEVHEQVITSANKATIIDEASATITYVGKAAIGSATSAAVWQVMRMNSTTGVVTTWADGDDEEDNVWDNRTTLTYS